MKKKNVKKFIFVCLKKSLLISLVISLFVFVPTITTIYNTRERSLSEKFFGKKAEYQGVINLWNVDTFEGGSASKSSFLEMVSLKFESKNKGAYINVQNLTIDEFLAKIKNNEKPHLFSFGTGVESYLKEYMISLPNDVAQNLKYNFYQAGINDSSLKAVAWCYSIYTLISSQDRIEKAKKEYNKDLKSLAFNLSYDKVYKKNTKHTYSLTFGGNTYVNALNNITREFVISVNSQAEMGIIDDKYKTNTFYEAYSRFVGGKSSMLLGTLRDVFRMENRIRAGKETNVYYESLVKYTDLVSYISVISSTEKIEKVSKDFVMFLISEEIQSKISDIGLFSPIVSNIYSEGIMAKIEDYNSENIKIKNLF